MDAVDLLYQSDRHCVISTAYYNVTYIIVAYTKFDGIGCTCGMNQTLSDDDLLASCFRNLNYSLKSYSKHTVCSEGCRSERLLLKLLLCDTWRQC